MKKKIRAFCFVALWIAGLLGLGVYYVLFAPRDGAYSEAENRTLTAFPEFSLESLVSGANSMPVVADRARIRSKI